jgi:hypothetical protein
LEVTDFSFERGGGLSDIVALLSLVPSGKEVSVAIPLALALTMGLLAPAAPAPDSDPGPTAVLKDSRPDPKDQKANESFLRGQVPRFGNGAVLKAALKDPAVATLPCLRDQREPEKWLYEKLKVTVQPEAGTLSVSLPGYDLATQMIIVNAVVEAYLEEDVRERRERCGSTLKSQEYLRERMGKSLQRILVIPPDKRTARDEKEILDLQEWLQIVDQRIRNARQELEAPTRLQWKERARGWP